MKHKGQLRGGLSTLATYGTDHYRRMAALSPKSGRPRRRTYDEIIASEASPGRKAGGNFQRRAANR